VVLGYDAVRWRAMIAVLDSNCFNDDARAARPKLQTVLEAASKGAIEVVVPEVVLDELDKQFSSRSNRAYKAIRAEQGELGKLGLPIPAIPEVDTDYRASLEAVLTASGVQIVPYPKDLRPAVRWAVLRRKPFDQDGKGFPDAVIWLTVLQLAEEHSEEGIVLVTADKDFAMSKSDPQLAKALREDLEAQGRPRDQVRRVPGISPFLEELGKRVKASRERAEELIEAGALDAEIESRILYEEVEQGPLRLGVELDNDPTIIGWDLEELRLDEAVTLPGNRIYLEVTAWSSAMLNLVIYRADYVLAIEANYVPFSVSNSDLNRHYVEAEAELMLELSLAITANEDGTDAEVDLLGVNLAPIELAARDLIEDPDDFLDQLRPILVGKAVEEYSPDEAIESDIEETTIEAVNFGDSLRIGEVFSEPGEELSAEVKLSAEGDVTWVVTAPSPFDSEKFAGLAENEESGAPFLHDIESDVPLEIEVNATWNHSSGWHDLVVTRVALIADEARARASRPTAAEALETERLLDMVEKEEEKKSGKGKEVDGDAA
jgi:predicted nucleic acid-binding protein